ncbi:MAG: hypothetical protein K8R99_00675 [Actinomycetia bacterium]|nr:hypothetical protein [Actinomycetes bacterium]
MNVEITAADLLTIYDELVTSGSCRGTTFQPHRAEKVAATLRQLNDADLSLPHLLTNCIEVTARARCLDVANDRLAAACARAVAATLGYDLALEADDPLFKELYSLLLQGVPTPPPPWLAGRITLLERCPISDQLELPGFVEPESLEAVRLASRIDLGVASMPGTPTAYIASALTRLKNDALEQIEAESQHVASILSEQGYRVHQPVFTTHPARSQRMMPAEVHGIDYSLVAHSDLLVMLGRHASTGAGKEIVWAERHLVPIVLVTPAGVALSRILMGSTGSVTVIQFDDAADLRLKLTPVAHDLIDDSRYHVANRSEREQRFRDAWLAMRRQIASCEVTARSLRRNSITAARVQEIMRSPTHYAGASREELHAISRVVGPWNDSGMPSELSSMRLSAEALVSLDEARLIEGWSFVETYNLAREGEAVLAFAGTGKRRMRLETATDWIAFGRAMGV